MPFSEEVMIACELNEARAWNDCVEGCAAAAGNPLRAEVAVVSELPVPIVAALNFALFNRVIGLGVARPAADDQIASIARVYADRDQTGWAVSLAPVAQPDDLAERLEAHGLRQSSDFAKVIQSIDDPPAVETSLRIEEIGPELADAFVAVTTAAFGVPTSFAAWFGGSIGRPGWHHYLGFDDDEPVSAGALFVENGIGWLGFGSTLPDHRGRGGQSAIMARRIRDAARLGCTVVHTETGAETAENPNPSYRNMLRTGFELAYLRPNYTPQSS